MDTAKRFKPRNILLWQKIADDPEALRMLDMFPDADVHIVKHQRTEAAPDKSMVQALLEGKKTIMIGQTSSFVNHFDGDLGPGVACRPYYKLIPISNGCPYYCTYCYLAFIYRKFNPYIKININYDSMFKQIRRTLNSEHRNVGFNMGEMLDSLALDHITNLTSMLVPFFSKLSRGFLMLLTKSSNIDNLLLLEPNDHVIVSWSLNAETAIRSFEPGTADLDQRIEAARLCQNHGYRVRFRIDPGILYPGWQDDYARLIRKALNAARPENITLGMLRLLPGHFHLARQVYPTRAENMLDHRFITGASDFKLRYPVQDRLNFYNLLIDAIRSFDKNIPISLCRETPEILNALKDRCDQRKCNCMI